MRKIKEVLRLKFEARLSLERIAAATGVSKGAVSNYVQRALQRSLPWPLPENLDDAALERLLFPQVLQREQYAHADYAYVHQELKRKGVTLQLLWEEYHAVHGERAHHYSHFCWHYQRFRDSLARSMRQTHRAGEKLFIDYSGDTMPVINAVTGEILRAEIFVASMGASKYTYAEATWTQQLPDWIASHIRMFEHLGCVPQILTPDCLKSAIKKACRYEPEENSTYGDMARHFGCAIIPARPKSPKDKAVVENHVLVVQRWILARLRNRQFFSLADLNAAIAELLVELNHRPFKKLPGCRAEAFESIDRPAMKPLPPQRYEYAEWVKAKVYIDYHVEADGHYYSVPHQLVGQHVHVLMTASGIECLFKGRRVAAHVRSYQRGAHTTLPEHMPESHRRHAQWTPGRLLAWGEKIGPGTRAVVQWQFDHRPHPEQGYRSCLGLLSLAKTYGEQRLEAGGSGKTFLACALAHQACRAGLSAWYVRAPRLFEELSLCHADGSFRKRLAAIAKISLLIIDDFAISPIGPRERNDLLELLDDRVGSRSSILASQLPIEHWHEYLNDPTLADAIMDRLIHRSHKIHLQGKESMRKRTGKEAAKN